MNSRQISEERKRERLALLWPEGNTHFVVTKLLILFFVLVLVGDVQRLPASFYSEGYPEFPSVVITRVFIWLSLISFLWSQMERKYARWNDSVVFVLDLLLIVVSVIAVGIFVYGIVEVVTDAVVNTGPATIHRENLAALIAKLLVALIVIVRLWRKHQTCRALSANVPQ